MNNRSFIFFVILTCVLSACSKKPSWVIPEKSMENLLYDIHLAEAEIDNDYITFSDSVRKRELVNAVFEKYHVTEAQFDTSLAWYASHLKIYVAMYERIEVRLRSLRDTLSHTQQIRYELENKPKELWADERVKVLAPLPLENRYTFRLDTSSYFSSGDMYELNFSVLGVSNNFRPSVAFAWESTDTTLVKRTKISSNGTCSVYLKAIPGMKTESLSGSIRVPIDHPGSQLILNKVTIYKYRIGHHPDIKETDPEEEKQSMLVADSVVIQSLPVEPRKGPMHNRIH